MSRPPSKTIVVEAKLATWTKVLAVCTGLLALTSAVSTAWVTYDEVARWSTQAADEERQRAQIVLFAGIVNAFDQDGTPTFAVAVSAKNAGATRTKYTKGFVSAHLFPLPLPDNINFKQPYQNLTQIETVNGPNDVISFVPIKISKEDLAAAEAGGSKLIAWSRVEYATIFKPNEPRYSSLCVLLTITKFGDNRTLNAGGARLPNGINIEPTPLLGGCNENG